MAHPGKVGRIIGCVIKLSEKPGQQAKWLSLQTIAPLRHHSVVVASGSGRQFARTIQVARIFFSLGLPISPRRVWPFSRPSIFRAHAVQNRSLAFLPSSSN